MVIATHLNEKLLFALLENSYEAICLLNEELVPFYRSPAAYQITGYTMAERKEYSFVNHIHPDDIEKWQKALNNTKANPRKPVFVNIRLKHKRGHYVILEVIYSNFLDDENLHAIVCNMRDITDRVEMEDTLHIKIKQVLDYKFALDQSSIVAVTDPKGIIRFVNDNFCKISKYSREELKGQDQRIFISEHHTEKFIKNVCKTIASGKVWKGEIKSKAKDETYYWTDTTIVPFLDKNGQPLQYMTIQTDISEKKKSEEKVNKMVNRFRQAQEIAHVGGWEVNFAAGKAVWSDEACRIYGIPGENIQSFESWISFIHPGDLDRVKKIIETNQKKLSDSSFKHRIICKDGTVKYIHSISKYEFDEQGKPIGLVGTCRDITESVLANEQIKKTFYRLNQAQEIAHLGSWERSLDSDKLIFSDEMCRIFGLEGENVMPFEEFINYVHPEDRDGLMNAIKESNKTFSDACLEHRIVLKSGAVKYLYSVRKFEFDEQNKPVAVIGISLDVTERKEAEKLLLQSKNLFREFFESAPEAICIVDIDTGRFVDFNMNALKMFKYLPHEMLQKTPIDISPKFQPDGKNSQSKVKDFIDMAMAGEKTIFEWLHCDALGREFICEVRLTRIPVPGGKDLLRGSIIDISEKKEAEKKLITSENQIRHFARHLNKVQEEERTHLAREIHDEIGQQLVGIKIGLSTLINQNGGDAAKELIKEVDSTIQSLRKIATELRLGILDSLGLIPSIQWLGKEFERKTGTACKISMGAKERKFEKCVSTVYFRICQEALTNISKHAEASEVHIEMKDERGFLTLKISDNGKGIVSKKLANPFSMGLLGMKERANGIEGDFKITSTKGKGTSVQLTTKINRL